LVLGVAKTTTIGQEFNPGKRMLPAGFQNFASGGCSGFEKPVVFLAQV
jgi:hypothetical protein